MAKSSLKIVLVDPLGDVLFSGDSLIGSALADNDDNDARPPATVSGIYPKALLVLEEETPSERSRRVA